MATPADLEQALLRRCSDDGCLAVYLDWLLEEGRGMPHLGAALRHPHVCFRGATEVVYRPADRALRFALMVFADSRSPEDAWVVLPAPGPDGGIVRHRLDGLDGPVHAQAICCSADGRWLVVPVRAPRPTRGYGAAMKAYNNLYPPRDRYPNLAEQLELAGAAAVDLLVVDLARSPAPAYLANLHLQTGVSVFGHERPDGPHEIAAVLDGLEAELE